MVSECQMHFPSPLRSQIGFKIQMAGCKSPGLGFNLHNTRGNESLLKGGNGPESFSAASSTPPSAPCFLTDLAT